jgi:aspartate dehydrogenase
MPATTKGNLIDVHERRDQRLFSDSTSYGPQSTAIQCEGQGLYLPEAPEKAQIKASKENPYTGDNGPAALDLFAFASAAAYTAEFSMICREDENVARTRIGLLGCGSIGGFLARHVLAEPADGTMELGYVYDLDDKRMQDIPPPCRVTQQAEMLARPADLVVEAAHADLVKAVAVRLVQQSDLLLFSLTALADDAFRSDLDSAAVQHGHKVYLPHGAILGIDGLVDAGPTLQSVTITTTKSPASLGLPPDSYQVVFEGPTREACAKFPRNVNVHAAVAMGGLGFDRTRSRIVADPAVSTNAHLVEVEGTGYRFRVEVSSEAGGKVTGAYTPQSALNTLRRLCRNQGGLRFA